VTGVADAAETLDANPIHGGDDGGDAREGHCRWLVAVPAEGGEDDVGAIDRGAHAGRVEDVARHDDEPGVAHVELVRSTGDRDDVVTRRECDADQMTAGPSGAADDGETHGQPPKSFLSMYSIETVRIADCQLRKSSAGRYSDGHAST